MTALEEMKSPVEAEIERVVQSVNEWDDRTSPDDYPEHLLITSEELADILRNFAESTLAILQRENGNLRMALTPFVSAFESRRKFYSKRYPSDPELGYKNFDKMPDDWAMEKIAFNMGTYRRARTALASTGGEHHAE